MCIISSTAVSCEHREAFYKFMTGVSKTRGRDRDQGRGLNRSLWVITHLLNFSTTNLHMMGVIAI